MIRQRNITWVIVASGPSLTDSDCARVKAAQKDELCRVLVIKDNWRKFPQFDVLYACDGDWWDMYAAELPKRGLKFTQDPDAAYKHDLGHVESRDAPGLCFEPWVINRGRNSGYQAINLAWHLGARRIALLGFDMQMSNGARHWFGDHPRGLCNPSAPLLAEFAPLFDALAQDVTAAGGEVTNCSRRTALTCFPTMPIGDWIDGIAGVERGAAVA